MPRNTALPAAPGRPAPALLRRAAALALAATALVHASLAAGAAPGTASLPHVSPVAVSPAGAAPITAAAPATPATPTAPAAKAAAPAAMPLLSAKELRALLDANRGRVVLINFWATFCAPCIKEIPELVRLERELGPRGLTLVGVALDEPADRTTRVEPFRAKYFPDFPTWLRSEADMDALVSAVDPAWNEILPTSYIIGRDGKVVRRIQGGKSYEAFREAVLPALGEG